MGLRKAERKQHVRWRRQDSRDPEHRCCVSWAVKDRASGKNGPYSYLEVSLGVMCWTLSLSTGGQMAAGIPYSYDSKLPGAGPAMPASPVRTPSLWEMGWEGGNPEPHYSEAKGYAALLGQERVSVFGAPLSCPLVPSIT